MSDAKQRFEQVRQTLNEADKALIEALDERARAYRELVTLRDAHADSYLLVPRDAEVIGHALERAAEFPRESVEQVFREILSATHNMMAPVRVAYLGPEGAFAHAAARRHFGAASALTSLDSVAGVLDEVVRSRADFGVVPLETSSDGALTSTLHGLVEAEVKICAELTLPSAFHLLSRTGNAADIEKIYGAPGAMAACERYLRTHLPRATLLDVPSGTVAAEFSIEDHGAAVLGTELIGEIEGLSFAKRHVEDVSGVEIRFAVVGNDLQPRTGADRTILALAVHDSPGALYAALEPFADRKINLTRLESRPARGMGFRYVFFMELDGHITDRPVVTAVEELRAAARFVKVLGSYPRPR